MTTPAANIPRRRRHCRRQRGLVIPWGDNPAAAHPGIQARCVELLGTGLDSVSNYGLSPELLASLVLWRAHGGEVTKLGNRYLDGDFPTPGYLAGVFDEFTAAGLLAIADPDSQGLRRVILTTAGHARHEQLDGRPVPQLAPSARA